MSEPLCKYPDCACPFDAPSDPNWCALGRKKAPVITPSLRDLIERFASHDTPEVSGAVPKDKR